MSSPIKIYSQFNVVVVPFPFTDSSAVKRRPALILSDAGTFNTPMQKGVMAMITTATHQSWALDISIADLSAAGLNAASIIRMKLLALPNLLCKTTLENHGIVAVSWFEPNKSD
jgi:mRNA interferase MazF